MNNFTAPKKSFCLVLEISGCRYDAQFNIFVGHNIFLGFNDLENKFRGVSDGVFDCSRF